MSEPDYKIRCEHYEKILGIGKYDPVKTAFLIYIKMLNQQIDFLNDFQIKNHIGDTDKDSPKYKRAMEMVDGLPKMITSVNDLRSTLKLTSDDMALTASDKSLMNRITTPESIASSIGDNKSSNV